MHEPRLDPIISSSEEKKGKFYLIEIAQAHALGWEYVITAVMLSELK